MARDDYVGYDGDSVVMMVLEEVVTDNKCTKYKALDSLYSTQATYNVTYKTCE